MVVTSLDVLIQSVNSLYRHFLPPIYFTFFFLFVFACLVLQLGLFGFLSFGGGVLFLIFSL